MYRVASLPEPQVLSRRAALLALRDELNQNATIMFQEFLRAAKLPG